MLLLLGVVLALSGAHAAPSSTSSALAATTFEKRVVASADDAEEAATGGMYLNSSDLELVYDGSNQRVGMRWTNVTIPKGATVSRAYMQFESKETQSEVTNLLIQGLAVDNPTIFTSANGNVSTRPRTSASATWSPVPWTVLAEAGPNERTPDLSAIIQEIVNRGGWASGNALAIIITGTGHRTARAWDSKPAGAPLLHVEYTTGPPPPNTAPIVNAGADLTVTLPAAASLDGTVTDDGLPNPPGATTTSWTLDSGPGTVSFQNPNAIDTQATFGLAGTYTLRLTANDSALTNSDTAQVTVLDAPPPPPPPPPGASTFEARVLSSADDAEEAATAVMYLNSSDLELVYDGSNQRVGMRWTAVTIPKGATIGRAYIQFESKETQSEVTNLSIQGLAADNPATFTSASGNVSTRPRTTASASWSPVPWTVIGEANANERTPDLTAVVQEIVIRPGWASGNALAMIVTGTGHRTARAWDIKPAGPPLLHVEYTTGPPPPT